ncbi:MAG: hypothetical protein A2017_11805 [Lentisphaerae bacterium GWF2_44_16]|nr:MAG: hypothetical protein A2017_11805 [Lentisphaerae bacterium GWF2_44_16]
MSSFYKTVDLTPGRAKVAERDSILSACCGTIGEVTFTDSAIIILYAGMLGASDMFSLITTAVMPLFNGIFIIPMAFFAYLMIVAAPFFGDAAVGLMIAMLILFAVSHTGYVAGWFPLLDTFLLGERRSTYLSKMRFCWQSITTVFILLAGLCIGGNPSLWHLQLLLLIAAIISIGSILFIARIPVFKTERQEASQLREGLSLAVSNKAMVGYSAYLFVLNLAAYGTIPMATLYLKKYLNAPDNIIVIISSAALGGMLLGSFCAGKIIKSFGLKNTFLGIHVTYALTNILIFLIGKNTMSSDCTYVAIAVLLLVYSFTFANANIASTTEMMALARPGNKVMAMAFCGTFFYGGSGLSRLVTSLVLGSGILAPEWHIGNITFCHYQTIFLIYSVAIVFVAMLLVVVPAIFPKGEYEYGIE